jgi:hypothetical protein
LLQVDDLFELYDDARISIMKLKAF